MPGAQIAATLLLLQALQSAGPGAAPPAASPAAPPASTTVSPLVVSPDVAVSKRRSVDLTEIVCHDELPPGTRFKVKVCATRRQFQERTRDQQDIVRDWQNTPITTKAQ